MPATSAAGPSKAIPDDHAAGVASSIEITKPGTVKDLDVAIPGLAHSYVGDLAIEVTSPAGTTVTLARHPGGPDNAADNFSGTVFDDEASTNISAGSAPYTGSFKPQNDQLSRFDGQQRQGTWTLRVRDLSEGDVGTLTSWHTIISRAICDFNDRDAPDTAITSGPTGHTASRTASFGFASNDGGSLFECSLDGGPPTSCDPQYAVAGLSEGTHTLRVQARDLADHLDPTAAERSWTVDATAPAVSLSTPRPGSHARGRASATRGVGRGGRRRLGDCHAEAVARHAGRRPSRADTRRPPQSDERRLVDFARAARRRALDRSVEQGDAAGNIGVSPPVTFAVGTVVVDNNRPRLCDRPG